MNRLRAAAAPRTPRVANQLAARANAGLRRGALGVNDDVSTQTTGSYTNAASRTRVADSCQEQVGLHELQVQGTLPQWLAGDLYRTGAGINAGYRHLFDGLAILVHFNISDRTVRWQQRYVRSMDYQRYMEAGAPQMSGWRTYMPPLQSMAAVALELSGLGTGITDNASVMLQPSVLDGELVALTETSNGRYRIKRDTLDTIAQLRDLKGSSVKGNMLTAHPVLLPDGSSVNVAQDPPSGRMQVFRTRLGDPAAEVEVLYDLAVSSRNKRHSWIHDLASTDDYLIIVEQPAFTSLMAFVGLKDAEYAPLDWCPEHSTSVRVVRLDGGGIVKSFSLPPLFAYHYINAVRMDHERLGRCLRLDVPLASSPKMMAQLDLDQLRNTESGDMDPALLKCGSR